MSNPNHEEELYAQAAAELEDGNRDEGLWAKCKIYTNHAYVLAIAFAPFAHSLPLSMHRMMP